MLFNIDAYGLPENEYPKGIKFLKYSRHAELEAENDRYGDYYADLPILLNCNTATLVEVEFNNDVSIKYIYRVSLNEKFDLCLVVRHDEGAFFVKTVWLNEKTDNHKTLNKTPYSKP